MNIGEFIMIIEKKKIFLICLTIFIVFVIIGGIVHKAFVKDDKTTEEWIEEKANIKITKIATFNNPIVPTGFKKVETETATWEEENGIPKGWNEGLVIEDEIGNQFVWVPVENLYAQYKTGDVIDYIDEEQSQIFQYGGFYIARYEAGITEEYIEHLSENELRTTTNNKEGIPTSKKGQIVWNYINWDRANENATKMYENNKYVRSDLMTVNQCDYIVTWIKNAGYNVDDSKEWGNYSNTNFVFTGFYSTDGKTYKYAENKRKETYNMLLSTGATERNKSKNIYDFAGNIAEFTDVSEFSHNEYVRGGYYDNNSVVSADSKIDISEGNNRQGFRVVLYINTKK